MTGLEFLRKECKDRIAYLAAGLAAGNIPSMEDYKFVCGQIRGLEAAVVLITDLERRMEDSDSE